MGLLFPSRGDRIIVTWLEKAIYIAEFALSANIIIDRFAPIFSVKFYILPVPTIVDIPELKNALMMDRNISSILELGERCDIAVSSVGVLKASPMLVKVGYITMDEMRSIIEAGAVAGFCDHYLYKTACLLRN
ncbi:MAG TPA: sugar-binding domain-containing protein [Desulfosporosinus sp.]|nr:sugar-binding domain-containing protein [Desulfosporosinus sp.]